MSQVNDQINDYKREASTNANANDYFRSGWSDNESLQTPTRLVEHTIEAPLVIKVGPGATNRNTPSFVTPTPSDCSVIKLKASSLKAG